MTGQRAALGSRRLSIVSAGKTSRIGRHAHFGTRAQMYRLSKSRNVLGPIGVQELGNSAGDSTEWVPSS